MALHFPFLCIMVNTTKGDFAICITCRNTVMVIAWNYNLFLLPGTQHICSWSWQPPRLCKTIRNRPAWLSDFKKRLAQVCLVQDFCYESCTYIHSNAVQSLMSMTIPKVEAESHMPHSHKYSRQPQSYYTCSALCPSLFMRNLS